MYDTTVQRVSSVHLGLVKIVRLKLSGRAKYVILSQPDVTWNVTLLRKTASFSRVLGLGVGDGRSDEDHLRASE